MGFKDLLINWIFKNIRIRASSVHLYVDECDKDKDGYIDVSELCTVLKNIKVGK